MPTDAFLAAARKQGRQPVVMVEVESIDAIGRVITTATDWDESKYWCRRQP